jgi:hypothetical protein
MGAEKQGPFSHVSQMPQQFPLSAGSRVCSASLLFILPMVKNQERKFWHMSSCFETLRADSALVLACFPHQRSATRMVFRTLF